MKTINNNKRSFLFYYGLSLILFLSLYGCDTDRSIVTDMTAGLPEQQKKTLEMFGYEWMKEAKICKLGEYMIAVPAKGSNDSILIMRGSQLLLLIQEGFGVNLFEPVEGPRNRYPIVNLQDWDKDGLFDRIFYVAFDRDGNVKAELFDTNLDGEPDDKSLHVKKDKIEPYAWVEDGWRRIRKKGGKPEVLIGGKWREIRKQSGKWVFVK